MKFTKLLLLFSYVFTSMSFAQDRQSPTSDHMHNNKQRMDTHLKEIFEIIASLSDDNQTKAKLARYVLLCQNMTHQSHDKLMQYIQATQSHLEKNRTKITETQFNGLQDLLAMHTHALNTSSSDQAKFCGQQSYYQPSCCQPYVTSSNTTACANAIAKFNGPSTSSIINAPLTAPNVSGIQATSAVLADDCVTTNLNLALTPKGTGALTAGIPDGTPVGGNARGNYAVDWQMTRTLNTEVASGVFSVIGGGGFNTASGDVSTIGGGFFNIASGGDSTIGGGSTNLVVGDGSTVGGGGSNTVLGLLSTIGGGSDNIVSGTWSTVGGGLINFVFGDESIISGGTSNVILPDTLYSTIGGGFLNIALSNAGSTIGGGIGNKVSTYVSTIAGGSGNTASGFGATVGGGVSNIISGILATTAGGGGNIASGAGATVPGGGSNTANGDFSFAAGLSAVATHTGSFVWADSTGAPDGTPFESSTNDEFNVRASGGTRIFSSGDLSTGVTLAPGGGAWVAVSDRNVKNNVQDVDAQEILNKLMQVPISSWNYKAQDASIRHIGPMAQDFNPAFGFTESALGISSLDCDGVALAAIQGLFTLYKNAEERIRQLEILLQQQQQTT